MIGFFTYLLIYFVGGLLWFILEIEQVRFYAINRFHGCMKLRQNFKGLIEPHEE